MENYRLVMSPEEARAWLRFRTTQGQALPQWAQEWDGESTVWLEEKES